MSGMPGAVGTVGLTLGAWLVLWLCLVLIGPLAGGAVGLAVGSVLAYGGLGTLAARAIPPPVDVRLGLRPMPARILLLVPTAILVSEADNWLALWLGADEEALAEQRRDAAALGALATVEWALFAVGLSPVVVEFFFRGVLLQGAVGQLGTARGLILVSSQIGRASCRERV